MRLPFVLAPLAAAALLCGCGSNKAAPTTTAASTSTAQSTVPTGDVTHAAPDLEALLPTTIAGRTLQHGSTTGAVVFGGDQFSKQFQTFLDSVGKKPSDLRFANAQDPEHKLEAEVGVFQVKGVDGVKLAQAIVEASRPNAPGLTASGGSLGGKNVLKVVYPGTSVLYLYPTGDRVFYVGAGYEQLAAQILSGLGND